MNQQDKARRHKIQMSGGTWRKYMRTEHTTTVFGAFININKQKALTPR